MLFTKIKRQQEKKNIVSMVPAPLWYILMFSGLILGWHPLSGDNFYQIAIGKIIVQQGIPHEIPLTVHTVEHLHYMAQQWLFMVLDYELFSHFGWMSLLFLGIILNIAIVYVAYRMLQCVGNGRRIAAYPIAFFISFFPLLMGESAHYLRPYFITCILLLLEVLTLESLRKKSAENKKLLIFPFFSLLSINLHAAMWPMIFVMLLPYYAETILGKFIILKKWVNSSQAIPLKKLVYASLLILLFAFLNPYGIEAMTYGFRSYGIPILRNLSNEMRPLWDTSFILAMFVVCIMALNLWLWKRYYIPLSYILLSLGTGFMALLSFRSLLLFLLFGMLPIAYLSRTWKSIFISKKWGPVLCMICLSLPVYFLEICYPLILMGPVSPHYARSEEVIRKDAERLSISPGPVFSYGFESSYLMIHGIPIYYFNSDESFTIQLNQKFDVIQEYLNFCRGRMPLATFDEKYGFHYYYVHKETLIEDALKKTPKFTLIYDSEKDPDLHMAVGNPQMCIYRGPSAQKL